MKKKRRLASLWSDADGNRQNTQGSVHFFSFSGTGSTPIRVLSCVCWLLITVAVRFTPFALSYEGFIFNLVFPGSVSVIVPSFGKRVYLLSDHGRIPSGSVSVR